MQTERRTALGARFFAIAAGILGVDQLTKLAVVRSIPEGDHIRVLGDVLVIGHIRNSGAAFGMLRGFGGVLALAAVVGIVVFAVIVWRQPSSVAAVAAALVAGGAAGNLTDRLVRGTVVDFIDFRFWPAFNVADTAITVGAIALVLFAPRRTK